MYSVKNKNNTSKRNVILAALLIVLIGAGLTTLYLHVRSDDKKNTSATGTYVNLDPPTDDEQKAGDDQKKEIVDQDKAEGSTAPTAASVVITDASQYDEPGGNIIEVRAYVSNLIETNGKCSVTLTNGGASVTRQVNATADATTTQCGTVDIPRGEFSTAGTWDVTVAYASSSNKGSASSKVIIK